MSAQPQVLPTLPGKVHGIVGTDPWTIQCDGCLCTWSHEHLILVVHKAEFNPRDKWDDRRLCDDCADEAGWQR